MHSLALDESLLKYLYIPLIYEETEADETYEQWELEEKNREDAGGGLCAEGKE